ncbi:MULTISPECIES: ATP-dependent endonuclease [Dethiosulfovibrio]|uniref:AAA family ATPase n=2 Tax=Dethiosulfovibrio TaxID=47054 RepID=A0ABS9ER58_9BACT|nr:MULTISPECIES: AAA family ATPase [Dethiosulfovibrio]MCF4115219.1 AAA family ATPase [Dethiosulfovibrio russensis]MCF4143682.1 AAA family ATPase [Dethiosulfovibrio marinus]MCF4146179.1 AAA family ATPase [Dethiosulfovibrio acidaminovorans]
MKISSVRVNNFRKLQCCHIEFSENTTLFVGANNSGKTSAMDALGKFLAGRGFDFNDFTISNRPAINMIGDEWIAQDCKIPEDLTRWDNLVPIMDVWLEVERNEIHYVASIIPTLKWRGGKLGVRLAFQPKDISKLFTEYREAYSAARTTESAGKGKDGAHINLYPKDLCDFIGKNLAVYFSIKSYVLDPEQLLAEPPQPTSYAMECFTDNPLKGIIRIDMIDAQRGFSDPDSSDERERSRKQLSTQMRSYYDKHLDPEKLPTSEDLEILEVTEQARGVFDKSLADKFAPAISELEGLGYPGVTDPKITITTKVSTSDTLKHDSAVQYALSKNDVTLKMPEKYNGLGYQNLISMVFDLMSFRDSWMRVGKARQEEDAADIIEPLHLVLVEEPEAHLHMQVQQVFIRKAYSVLRNHNFLNDKKNFATQLVISTHSSHIARETNFADLRYFKRLPECASCNIATAKVINLSDVFGKEDETDKFVTRYLQTTHCDLFFADAAILVEGSAESMLVPHFIKDNYPELHQRYVSILNINGRHSHRLSPLIDKLCLPTLVISDLDSVEPGGHHKAARPVRNEKLISGNYAITDWLLKENGLDTLLDLPAERKVFANETAYKYSIRIAYQTPVKINFNGTSTETLSSTFEDCLIYTNYKLFKDLKKHDLGDDAGNLIKKVNIALNTIELFNELHAQIYRELREGKSDQKAEFALDLIYTIDPRKLTVPKYIAEGLKWLQALLCPEEC